MPNLFRLFLIAVLVLTSQVLGSARGQAKIAGMAVLCAGEAVITVQVDADGQPVKIVTICPDMALSLMQGLDHLATLPPRRETAHVLHAVPLSAPLRAMTRVALRARDPPFPLPEHQTDLQERNEG